MEAVPETFTILPTDEETENLEAFQEHITDQQTSSLQAIKQEIAAEQSEFQYNTDESEDQINIKPSLYILQ